MDDQDAVCQRRVSTSDLAVTYELRNKRHPQNHAPRSLHPDDHSPSRQQWIGAIQRPSLTRGPAGARLAIRHEASQALPRAVRATQSSALDTVRSEGTPEGYATPTPRANIVVSLDGTAVCHAHRRNTPLHFQRQNDRPRTHRLECYPYHAPLSLPTISTHLSYLLSTLHSLHYPVAARAACTATETRDTERIHHSLLGHTLGRTQRPSTNTLET